MEARRRELEEGRRRTEDVTWSKVPFPCPCHDQPRLWIHHCALVPQLWPWTTPTSGPIADSRHGSCRDYIHAAKGFRRGHGTQSFSRRRDVDGLRLRVGAVAQHWDVPRFTRGPAFARAMNHLAYLSIPRLDHRPSHTVYKAVVTLISIGFNLLIKFLAGTDPGNSCFALDQSGHEDFAGHPPQLLLRSPCKWGVCVLIYLFLPPLQ